MSSGFSHISQAIPKKPQARIYFRSSSPRFVSSQSLFLRRCFFFFFFLRKYFIFAGSERIKDTKVGLKQTRHGVGGLLSLYVTVCSTMSAKGPNPKLTQPLNSLVVLYYGSRAIHLYIYHTAHPGGASPPRAPRAHSHGGSGHAADHRARCPRDRRRAAWARARSSAGYPRSSAPTRGTARPPQPG